MTHRTRLTKKQR